MNDITEAQKEREYIEIMASLRHYSSLRFTAMSVFYAATAALVVAAFGFNIEGVITFDTQLRLVFHIFGVLITIIFFAYDFMLNGYQEGFRNHLQSIWPSSHWFKRPWYGLLFQWPAWSLYTCILIFWIVTLVIAFSVRNASS